MKIKPDFAVFDIFGVALMVTSGLVWGMLLEKYYIPGYIFGAFIFLMFSIAEYYVHKKYNKKSWR